MTEWDKIADELDHYAEQLESGMTLSGVSMDVVALAREATQLVRRVDADAADQLEINILRRGSLASSDRGTYAAIIRGAAKSARLAGPRLPDGAHIDTGSTQNVNVNATANADATAIAVATAKSAVAVNIHTGDIRTHIFKINPAADGEMFNGDGSLANGATGVTLSYACYSCHDDPDGVGGGTAPQKTLLELSAEATGFHD